jgi:hypothetical protein
MKRSILAATLLAIGFAWCSAAHAQDKQKPTADAIKPAAPVNKANANIIGPSNKSAPASDAKSVKATPSVKPSPKPNTAAAPKNKATMGQGSAVMMKEKSEPPPPKKEPGSSGGPKDPKPKKDVMMEDKAALKLAPGQSQK